MKENCYGLHSYGLYSYGPYCRGLYSYGLYIYCLYIVMSYTPCRYGLCSYGPYSYGLYNHGLYSRGLYRVMAYIVMAHSYGLCCFVLYSPYGPYGPYSYGLCSYGLYSYGLHISAWTVSVRAHVTVRGGPDPRWDHTTSIPARTVARAVATWNQVQAQQDGYGRAARWHILLLSHDI